MTPTQALVVRNLSKQYRRGTFGIRTLRDELQVRFSKDEAADTSKKFYALRDVSFTVDCGTILGVVGANGSGKTTLMKVLASITEPTSGEVLVRGRVGSLLEVGAGFDPELDGIENIYLNGAILGMSRMETRRKLEQIVAFADVGPALNTPVKRYSSGMFMRLAFAVSAHLDSEILLVDEVLAVGDASFQRKCLATIKDLASQGRTILLVSHNMSVISQMCDRAIFLDKGRVIAGGSADAIADRYLDNQSQTRSATAVALSSGLQADLNLCDENGSRAMAMEFGGRYRFDLVVHAAPAVGPWRAAVSILRTDGELVSTMDMSCESGAWPGLGRSVVVSFHLRPQLLLPGSYYARFAIVQDQTQKVLMEGEAAYPFSVYPGSLAGAPDVYSHRHGLVRLADSVTVREYLSDDVIAAKDPGLVLPTEPHS
jgi:lipopolysaccharide transport system ATP-binding protein